MQAASRRTRSRSRSSAILPRLHTAAQDGPAARRLLAATATAAAVGAVVTAAILDEHRMSGDRTVPLGKASTSSQSHSKAGTASIKTRRVAGPGATSSGRRLAWAPVANASTYTVEIVGGGDLTYSATTGHAYVRVPDRWRRTGRTMTLSAGTDPLGTSGQSSATVPSTAKAGKRSLRPCSRSLPEAHSFQLPTTQRQPRYF